MGKNLHKGYYGQYSGNSKFSKKHDEDYDAKEAYNKNLTASARLHYLENLRHDHDSAAKHINEFMDENHQHNKNHDERPMHSHKNYEPKKKAAPKMSALPAHGDEFREKAKAASKGEQGDYNYDDPKVVALLDKAKKADAEHQKEQPDAAVKMSALHVEGGKAAHASMGSIRKYQEHIKVQQHHTDPSAPRDEQDPTNPNHPHYRKPKKGQQNK
tara:strand:+ start:1799 stop:2440 length:642 start_codon:yes stop_codon:yes gene_type:complete